MVGVVGFEPTITWSQIKWINQTLLHSVYLIKKQDSFFDGFEPSHNFNNSENILTI